MGFPNLSRAVENNGVISFKKGVNFINNITPKYAIFHIYIYLNTAKLIVNMEKWTMPESDRRLVNANDAYYHCTNVPNPTYFIRFSLLILCYDDFVVKLGFFLALVLLFTPVIVFAAPSISSISDSGQTGKYEKFEVTASVNTSAGNMFFPYDTTAVAGLTPGLGVSVDGLFTPDNWSTVYKQPGFYFVEYSENGSLYYPTGNTFWKVRFAPNKIGDWQYKISVKDAGWTIESQPRSFTVVDSNNHGFVQVSKNDSRYFEFSDGTYFPGLGVNDFIDRKSVV